mgnify:CR=1 FL=1
MNIIFLDFDGVIYTLNMNLNPKEPKDAIEKRIEILARICELYNCKVVIISAHKDMIIRKTMTSRTKWIQNLLDSFKTHGIEVIDRTPCVKIEIEPGHIIDIWKEAEILAYLKEHPEVEHYCIIDDDDRVSFPNMEKGDFRNSDLNMFREYLISPLAYSSTDPTIVGLQESHIEEVGKILQKKRKI